MTGLKESLNLDIIKKGFWTSQNDLKGQGS